MDGVDGRASALLSAGQPSSRCCCACPAHCCCLGPADLPLADAHAWLGSQLFIAACMPAAGRVALDKPLSTTVPLALQHVQARLLQVEAQLAPELDAWDR